MTNAKIVVQLIEKLDKAGELDRKGIPVYKVLMRLLDEYNSCCFYGDFVIRLNGLEIKSISYDNVSIRLDDSYEEEE